MEKSVKTNLFRYPVAELIPRNRSGCPGDQ